MGKPLGSRYVLESALGRGATGEVWRGSDRDGAVLAFKVLHESLAGDPAIVQRFLQERAILTSLDHPNLVRVRDVVAEGSTLAIVMDLVGGGDLRTALATHRTLPPAEVCRIGAEVAAGLAAVHAAGVVHRDVKPENILLDTTADPAAPKLTDFGIATIADQSRTGRSTMLVGTPHYLAPEVFDGQPPSPAADLYALGIVVFEMCCGVTPFAAESTLALLRQHVDCAPGRPDDVPEPLWQVIAQLLAKDPQVRFGPATRVANTLTALAHDLAGAPAAPARTAAPPPVPLVHIRPTELGTPHPAPSAAPGRRRSRLLLASLAAAVVGAACLSGWAVAQLGRGAVDPAAGAGATPTASDQTGVEQALPTGQAGSPTAPPALPAPTSPAAPPTTAPPEPMAVYEDQTIRLPSPERCTTQGLNYRRYGASWLDLDEPRVDVEDFDGADLVYYPCAERDAGLLAGAGLHAGYAPGPDVPPEECENAARTNRIDEPLHPEHLQVGDALCMTTKAGHVARLVISDLDGSATFQNPSSVTFAVTLWEW